MKVDLAAVVLGWDKALGSEDHLLTRAIELAEKSGTPIAEMLEWRLASDMFPLRWQFQVVSNLAQQWAARAADLDIPADQWGDSDVAQLREMIASARRFIASIPRDRFEGRDDASVTVKLGEIEPTMPVGQWVTGFANTNILFHLTTIYAILRSRGAPLGKPDLFAGGL